jgi:hypothetical protein
MYLKNIKKIESAEQFAAVCLRVDELIKEASNKELLEPDYDNDYTREIGHLSRLGAIYEDEYMTFEHINVGKTANLTSIKTKIDANLILEYA